MLLEETESVLGEEMSVLAHFTELNPTHDIFSIVSERGYARDYRAQQGLIWAIASLRGGGTSHV